MSFLVSTGAPSWLWHNERYDIQASVVSRQSIPTLTICTPALRLHDHLLNHGGEGEEGVANVNNPAVFLEYHKRANKKEAEP